MKRAIALILSAVVITTVVSYLCAVISFHYIRPVFTELYKSAQAPDPVIKSGLIEVVIFTIIFMGCFFLFISKNQKYRYAAVVIAYLAGCVSNFSYTLWMPIQGHIYEALSIALIFGAFLLVAYLLKLVADKLQYDGKAVFAGVLFLSVFKSILLLTFSSFTSYILPYLQNSQVLDLSTPYIILFFNYLQPVLLGIFLWLLFRHQKPSLKFPELAAIVVASMFNIISKFHFGNMVNIDWSRTFYELAICAFIVAVVLFMNFLTRPKSTLLDIPTEE